MVIKDKIKNECLIADFAIPNDSRIETKEFEKLDKYQDLARELKKLWNMNVRVIPIVICALGTTPKDLHKKDLKKSELRPRLLNCRKQLSLILPESSGKSSSFEETCCHQASRTNMNHLNNVRQIYNNNITYLYRITFSEKILLLSLRVLVELKYAK